MASSQMPPSTTHASGKKAARTLDGASLVDYESSDMARAVHEVQGRSQMENVGRKLPVDPEVTNRKAR